MLRWTPATLFFASWFELLRSCDPGSGGPPHPSPSDGGAPAPEGKLYWTENDAVRSASLDGTNVGTFATGIFPTGVTYDPVAKKLYWSDNGTDTVERANEDGSAREVLHATGDPFLNPNGLAVDPDEDRIFFTVPGALYTARRDGTQVTAIVPLAYPTDVAVDAAAKKVYVTDNLDDAVRRANYDGTGVEIVYQSADPYANPTAVALDVPGGRLYWTETGAIKSANLDGTDISTFRGANYPSGLAIDLTHQTLYVSDNFDDTITRVNLDGTGATVVYTSPAPFWNPRHIAIAP